jgi:ABC-type branched-subunit amino acid transport system substrate-binding protein
MEVVESELFRGTALAVEEINRAGGVAPRYREGNANPDVAA